jgi:hypothetical protein
MHGQTSRVSSSQQEKHKGNIHEKMSIFLCLIERLHSTINTVTIYFLATDTIQLQ